MPTRRPGLAVGLGAGLQLAIVFAVSSAGFGGSAARRLSSSWRAIAAAASPSGGATCTSAPITMMLLIAFVTLMSGVCNAGVTFHTTM
mgnify:CR=1 FL=1